MKELVKITADRYERMIEDRAHLENLVDEANMELGGLHAKLNLYAQKVMCDHIACYGNEAWSMDFNDFCKEFGIILDKEEINEAKVAYDQKYRKETKNDKS